MAEDCDNGYMSLDSTIVRAHQLLRTQHGITTRMAYMKPDNSFSAEVAVLAFPTDGSSAIRPKIGYALTDSVRLIVGADMFSGSKSTYFGQLKQNTTGFAEVRFRF